MQETNGAVFNHESQAELTFTIGTSLHRDYEGENFVHDIRGKILIRNVETDTEEMAGQVRACLIQFNEAQAQGIKSRVLGDGQSQEITSYWEELFDPDGDELKAAIQRRWQTEGSNLLIIASLQTLPRFEAQGIGLAALARTIDLFGRSCDLVACCPDAMKNFSDEGSPCTEERTDVIPAIASLQRYCLELGFRAWHDSGIYLLNPSHARQPVLLN